MAESGGHPIHIPYSNNSDDNYTTKSKIVKLNRNNWHHWKSAFEDIIIGKGYKEILDKEWIKNNAHTKTYQRKKALALSLLRNSIERDLLSCVKSNKSKFNKAYRLLANKCGESLLIVISDALISFHGASGSLLHKEPETGQLDIEYYLYALRYTTIHAGSGVHPSTTRGLSSRIKLNRYRLLRLRQQPSPLLYQQKTLSSSSSKDCSTP